MPSEVHSCLFLRVRFTRFVSSHIHQQVSQSRYFELFCANLSYRMCVCVCICVGACRVEAAMSNAPELETAAFTILHKPQSPLLAVCSGSGSEMKVKMKHKHPPPPCYCGDSGVCVCVQSCCGCRVPVAILSLHDIFQPKSQYIIYNIAHAQYQCPSVSTSTSTLDDW